MLLAAGLPGSRTQDEQDSRAAGDIGAGTMVAVSLVSLLGCLLLALLTWKTWQWVQRQRQRVGALELQEKLWVDSGDYPESHGW
jgi:hypothetical protein